MLQSLREETEGKLQMLLSLRKNGLTSLFKEVRVFKVVIAPSGKDALYDSDTRALMQKITFSHGGPEYDAKYPDGIPTSMDIKLKGGKTISSGLVMYPSGHARNTTADLKATEVQRNQVNATHPREHPPTKDSLLKLFLRIFYLV